MTVLFSPLPPIPLCLDPCPSSGLRIKIAVYEIVSEAVTFKFQEYGMRSRTAIPLLESWDISDICPKHPVGIVKR